ncbi:hypothetical protein RIR_jg12972.t1 [Rhizophagus irregularis DAOM 181602=DAOM 197198]|nr:hypothetical protein RIR_jg12972.t1 [Rhizophagus irregularis DAOM 181602=DAOM 197198]
MIDEERLEANDHFCVKCIVSGATVYPKVNNWIILSRSILQVTTRFGRVNTTQQDCLQDIAGSDHKAFFVFEGIGEWYLRGIFHKIKIFLPL